MCTQLVCFLRLYSVQRRETGLSPRPALVDRRESLQKSPRLTFVEEAAYPLGQRVMIAVTRWSSLVDRPVSLQ